MTPTPAVTREEGVRKGDDSQTVAIYRADCRREGERLLAWYRRSMSGCEYPRAQRVLELAVHNQSYLLPTLRRLITEAEVELAELRRAPQAVARRLPSLQRYLNGLQSLWAILLANLEDSPRSTTSSLP